MPVCRVDPPRQPPGFFLRLWLFFVKLAHSSTDLFKSRAPSTTLPTPVTAGSQTVRHKPPVPRRLELVDVKLSNRHTPQRGSQKNGLSSQSPAEIYTGTLYRDGSGNQNEDLRTKKHTTSSFSGFIGRMVSPGCISEAGALRTPTSLRSFTQPLDRDLRRCNSITPVVTEMRSPALLSSSPLPPRRLPLRITSITNDSILGSNPMDPRLTNLPHSTAPRLRISSSARFTQVSTSESFHSVSVSPFAIRRGFSGASVKVPHPSIRLESPWSPPDKTLPHDVWMNSEGVLANVQGPLHVSFNAAKSSQDDVVALQHGPYTPLPCAPSSRFSDDGDDFISVYSNIFDLPEEEKYEEGSSKGTSQGDSFDVNAADKSSPPSGAAAVLVKTTPVDDSVIIKHDATQDSAEDIEFKDSGKSDTSSELEEGFFYVISQSKFDLTLDDHTSGLAYIPSSKHREAHSLSIATEHVDHPDRATKRFSLPCLHSIREFDQSPLRPSTSDSSPSKHPTAAESRSLRALADLISLLDFAAMEAAETTGVPNIHG
ncbi:uncharacterized protein EDB93DRAFT_1251447 [Suillus bovinus]|uniref:uncharacterized protein n=1 Tax=Suillus bovinus TaxID=48563 RepID=UPI001B86BD36|nr:uncharacterized protein EDB93DRAFT_1251447 [Suillus bovinus]KAG2145346.1 hypothetical protein EDB93DRAFT_1251447 [Suillus bovinus]